MILFSEDFEDGEPKWKKKVGRWKIENGVYKITDANGIFATCLVGEKDWSDYTIELDARIDTFGAITIPFYAKDLNNYYLLVVYGGGNSVYFDKFKDGKIEKRSDLGWLEENLSGSLHIKLVINSSTFRAYINDRFKVMWHDEDYKSGMVGIQIPLYFGFPLEYSFDNILIYKEKNEEVSKETTWTWAKSFGTKYADKSTTMAIADDGGYVIYGQLYNHKGAWDFFNLKVNKKGKIEWAKKYLGDKSETAIGYGDITNTSDGGFVFANLSKSFSKNRDENIVVIKLSKNGDIEWQRIIFDNEGEDEGVWKIIETSDDGYLVGGTGVFKGRQNVFIIKLSQGGKWRWGEDMF